MASHDNPTGGVDRLQRRPNPLPDLASDGQTCEHCYIINKELRRCIAVGGPLDHRDRYGAAAPFWGYGSVIPDEIMQAPVFQMGDCICKCHAPARMLLKTVHNG